MNNTMAKDQKKINWRKIGLITLFLVVSIFIWYITLPALFIWWFVSTKRISKKAKVISSITAGVLFLVLCVGSGIAYYKDPTPSLQIQEPTDNTTIKGHSVTIKGTYQPNDRTVWVNGKKVSASNGQFEVTQDLNLGSNTIEIEAGNWKRTKQELHVSRELNDEEVAANKKAEEERAAQEKAQQEADAKAKADQEAQNKAEQEPSKPDNSTTPITTDDSTKYRNVTGFNLTYEKLLSGVQLYNYETTDGKYSVELQIEQSTTSIELEQEYTLSKGTLEIKATNVEYAFNKGSTINGTEIDKPYESAEFAFVVGEKTYFGFVRKNKEVDHAGIESALKSFVSTLIPNLK